MSPKWIDLEVVWTELLNWQNKYVILYSSLICGMEIERNVGKPMMGTFHTIWPKYHVSILVQIPFHCLETPTLRFKGKEIFFNDGYRWTIITLADLWPSVRTIPPPLPSCQCSVLRVFKAKATRMRRKSKQTLDSPRIELGTSSSEGWALTNWATPASYIGLHW